MGWQRLNAAAAAGVFAGRNEKPAAARRSSLWTNCMVQAPNISKIPADLIFAVFIVPPLVLGRFRRSSTH